MNNELLFQSPEELQAKVDAYFAHCEANPITVYHKQLGKSTDAPVQMNIARPYTVNGLAAFLGTSRMVLLNYRKKVQKDNPHADAMAEILDRACEKIGTHQLEHSLVGAYDSRTVQFMLINNHQYMNEKVVDHRTGGEPITKIVIQ